MSVEANKEVVRRFNAINGSGNEDELDEILSPDFVAHGSTGDITGIEAWKQFIRDGSAGQEVQSTVDELIADGDWVAERWTMRSTDPTTGKQTTYNGMTIHRFENGKLREDWAIAEMSSSGS
jgi:predicted ester cyclase